MRSRADRDFKYERLENTLRLYRTGLLLCLLLIVVLLVVLLAGHRARIARAIRVDGQVICLVPNRAAAERVRAKLLAPVKAKWGDNPCFREKWDHIDWPVSEEYEVGSVEQAVARLAPLLTPLITATALTVDGRQAVILPDRDTADKTLEALKAKFLAPNDKLIEQHFKSKVQPLEVQVPPDRVTTDIGRAVELLLAGPTYERSYTVRKEDTLEKIARTIGLTTEQLLARAPALKQGPKAGLSLQVKFRVPPLRVISVKEVVIERAYSVPPQEVTAITLPAGERRVASEGKPGLKRVTQRQTYENDEVVKKEDLKGEIIKEAVPGRVMVGQRPLTPAGAD